jgi:hypothetical protein
VLLHHINTQNQRKSQNLTEPPVGNQWVGEVDAYLWGVMIEFLKDVAYLWMEFPITTLVLTIAAVFCAYFIYCSVDILFHDPLQKHRDSGRS